MRNLSSLFKNRIIDYEKLEEYGFIKKENIYYYEKNILSNDFTVILELSDNIQLSKVIDLETKEEYILVDIDNSKGEFVETIKKQYENVIDEVIYKCTSIDVFKNKQTKQIIRYIKDKYNCDLEYLWEKFPDNAIWRNQNNKKWFGLIITITEDKLGLNADNKIEILDLRYQKENIKNIVDNQNIFPGYHMNKNSWITIILDGRINIKDIYDLIDNSYSLTDK